MKCRHTILEIPYSTNFITTTIVNFEPVFNHKPLVESLIRTINYCCNKYQVQNYLGQITEINLGNGIKTTFGYWGVGGAYDNSGGYYGRLWEIKTSKQPGSSPVLQDIQHTWDAGGNLSQRRDVLTSENETFNYDFLDRLTSVSGPYAETFTYDQIGNITSKNGVSYTYGTKPHAVTAVGTTNYVYDNNGNMTNRGGQTITWDVENRAVSVSENGTTSTFVYDGNGTRIKKTEGGQTIVYVNGFYEKNITTSEVTTNYLLGGSLIAQRKGTNLQYLHQDHLGSTAVTTNSNGSETSTIKYFPFGECRNSPPYSTDILFTGQRLDSTGLYYYGARYYDANIGRFISVDPLIPDVFNPRELDPFSYCLNNPLRFIDPEGTQIAIWDVDRCVVVPVGGGGYGTGSLGLGSGARAGGGPTGADKIAAAIASFFAGLWAAMTGSSQSNTATSTSSSSTAVSLPAHQSTTAVAQADTVDAVDDSPVPLDPSAKPDTNAGANDEPIANGGETVKPQAVSDDKIERVAQGIKEWLGEGAYAEKSKSGKDNRYISRDGKRQIRPDINDPKPHESPHINVEELINGKWIEYGPVFPKDVLHK